MKESIQISLWESLHLHEDKRAFDEIYEFYWYRIYLVAYRRLKNKEIAEEIAQDIFLKLWEKKSELYIKSLENYLFSSVKFAVIDHIRKQILLGKYTDHYQLFQIISENQVEEQLNIKDLSTSIEAGITQLPEKSQIVFRLSRFDFWTNEQIASHLQLSEKSVEYHLTKSLKFLRNFLKSVISIIIIFFFN